MANKKLIVSVGAPVNGGGVPEAPIDGKAYARKDADWEEISSGTLNHSGLNLDDGTNPHGTTKNDVNLGNVDNTSDLDKPISTATQAALDDKADKSNVLELDNTTTFTPTSDYEPATKKYVDDNAGGTIPNAAYNVVGGVKMSRDSASSTTYISFDGTDTPNVT